MHPDTESEHTSSVSVDLHFAHEQVQNLKSSEYVCSSKVRAFQMNQCFYFPSQTHHLHLQTNSAPNLRSVSV